MDPRTWSREHRLAWLLTIVIGGMLGTAAMVTLFPPTARFAVLINILRGEGPDAAMQALRAGALYGALVAGSVFYVVKLINVGNKR
jgi:hypothetical protein